MKRKITLLLAAVLIFALTGCAAFTGNETADGENTTTLTPVPQENDDAVFLGITLTAKDVTASGLTIVCTQSGGESTGELSTGSWYRLDRLVDGEWTEVEYSYDESQGELVWTSEAWLITMGSTTEWTVNWEWIYGELPSGTYRIAKEVMDWRAVGDYTHYYCFADFIIE